MSCYLFCGRVFAGRNTINVDGHMETASLITSIYLFCVYGIAFAFADCVDVDGHMETRANCAKTKHDGGTDGRFDLILLNVLRPFFARSLLAKLGRCG